MKRWQIILLSLGLLSGLIILISLDWLAGLSPPYFRPNPTWVYTGTLRPSDAERNGRPVLVITGDSIAAGWGDCRFEPCRGLMRAWVGDALAPWVVLRYRGIGSSTTGDLVARWEQDSADADLMLILSGVNDMARGVSSDEIMANFEVMYQRATGAGIKPIFSTIIPADSTPPERLADLRAVNAALLARAAEDGWLVIDLHSVMSDPGNKGYLRRTEITYEGSSHPNALGYERMAAALRWWWAVERP